MKYLKKILSLFQGGKSKVKVRSRSVLSIWHTELFVAGALLLAALSFDFMVYHILVARGVRAIKDRVSTVEVLQKQTIVDAATTVADHEKQLSSPTFPLIKTPF